MACHELALHPAGLAVVGERADHFRIVHVAVHDDDGDSCLTRLLDRRHDARSIHREENDGGRLVADRLVQLVDLQIAVALGVEEFHIKPCRFRLLGKSVLELHGEGVVIVVVRVDHLARSPDTGRAAARQEETPQDGQEKEQTFSCQTHGFTSFPAELRFLSHLCAQI